MSHVRTSRSYPRSSGKIERFHRRLKSGSVRVTLPRDLARAQQVVAAIVALYNGERLNFAIGVVAPLDRLACGHRAIHEARHL